MNRDLGWFGAVTRLMSASGTRRGLVRGGLAALGLGALRLPWTEKAAAQSTCTVCLNQGDCPFTSVQAALTAAAPGSTVTVCKGTYKETVTIARNVSLVADRGEDVVLDGAGRESVVTVEPGVAATLQGLRIVGGRGRDSRSGGRGGGIVNFGNLTVNDCVVEDNKGQSGGGIANENRATLRLVTSRVQHNDGNARLPSPAPGAPTQGGGISNSLSGTVTVVDSVIVENTANTGGGVANQGDTTITDNSRVSGNTADFGGGGILSLTLLAIRNGSTVAENEAEDNGGGILVTSGSLVLSDARITGNTARNGGGVAFSSALPFVMTVRRSFIVNNTATETGGGLFVRDNARVNIDAESKVSGNEPNNCVGTTACRA